MELVVDIGIKYPQITGPMADAFAAELDKLVNSPEYTSLVLDFQGTKVLSSMAIATLFSAFQKLKEQKRKMKIINASDRVTHLLRMVNMTDILT